MHSLGVYTAGQPDDASLILLAREGDLWPFTPADIERQAARYAADPRFERLTDGPLIVFRRRSSTSQFLSFSLAWQSPR
jgi:hypothetical protein